MKVFQFKIILLSFTLLQGIEVSAKQAIKMIAYDGLAKYADRFEFLPSDDCNLLKCDPGAGCWTKKTTLFQKMI